MSGTIIYIHEPSDNNKIVHSYYTGWEDDEEAFKQFLDMTDHTAVSEDYEQGLFIVKDSDAVEFNVSFCSVDEFTQIS